MTNSATILTVGHSIHTREVFLRLLATHGVTAVCDVRSRPYSRMSPHFNREDLREALSEEAIAYVFLGQELGARTGDRTCYRDGKVQFNLLSRTESFQRGLHRVEQGSRKHRVALMCAEKEPLECHRSILVARHLVSRGLDVQHIHADGRLESQRDASERLMEILKLRTQDLFHSHAQLIEDAYDLQGERIAYDSAQEVRGELAISEVS
jgi:uncharacterized protein (DUF488 family)